MKSLFDFIKELDAIGVCTDADIVAEIADNVENDEPDFEVDDHRFIRGDMIDEILVDELASDEYLLGCFADWAISEATDLPRELIKIIQNADEFQALGEWIAQDIERVEKLAAIYVSNDGYGHHFGLYDGQEHEINIDGKLFHVFRTN